MRAAAIFSSVVLATSITVGGAAHAATLITIGTSTDGGATIQDRASGATNAGILGLSVGAFDLNQITASFGPAPNVLDSTALDADSKNAAGGMLDVFVTIQGLTSADFSGGFTSSFTENVLTKGWTVTQSTFADNGNVKYGMATPLSSHVFTMLGTDSAFNPFTAAGTFSLTERYHVVANGKGSASSTIDLSTNAAAAPEPAAWTFMLVGFGAAGALLRRRRSLATA